MGKKKLSEKDLIGFKNNQNISPLPITRLQKRAKYFLSQLAKKKKHALSKKTEINFTFIDDKQMKVWHLDYLGDASPTDVIAFPMREGKQIKGEENLLGDVLVSVETAKRQAKEYDSCMEQELTLYMIHGVLHLLGYDDLTENKKKVMDHLQFSLLEETIAKVPLTFKDRISKTWIKKKKQKK